MRPPCPSPVCEQEIGQPDDPGIASGQDTARSGLRWILLPRHGRRPLAVWGRCLLQTNNRCAGLPWWSAITLHETGTGGFAVALCHAAGEGVVIWQDASVHASAEAARETLERHDPLQALPVTPRIRYAWPGVEDAPEIGRDLIVALRFCLAWAAMLGALFGRRTWPAPAPPGHLHPGHLHPKDLHPADLDRVARP